MKKKNCKGYFEILLGWYRQFQGHNHKKFHCSQIVYRNVKESQTSPLDYFFVCAILASDKRSR